MWLTAGLVILWIVGSPAGSNGLELGASLGDLGDSYTSAGGQRNIE
jgi:hypothetical protein